MGGYRSGRKRDGWRLTLDQCLALDVNLMHRAGCLTDGWKGCWQWPAAGRSRDPRIGVASGDCRVTLDYLIGEPPGRQQNVVEAVPVEWRPCRLGGTRPFFRCPGLIRGVACHRRVVKLYLADDVFLCRHCCGLPYSCQFEGPADRARWRADKLRIRLGGEPGAFAPWPERPRGMRWHRYERMCSEISIAERRADAAMTERTCRLLAQVARSLGET